MLLNSNDQRNLLKRFPKFELSYEQQIHKKVYNKTDIFVSVPHGTKYFAWFTYYHNNNACIIIELHHNKKIKNMQICTACFSDTLSLGTILYGTMVDNRFFVAEAVYYNAGFPVKESKRFKTLSTIFRDHIKQLSFISINKKNLKSQTLEVIFTTPLMSESYDDLIKQCESLPYQIYGIRFMCQRPQSNVIDRVFVYKQQKIDYNAVFKIKPTIQNDIYELYYFNRGGIELHNKCACIQTYSTSVMMNSLFRDIKENRNLDALEESDDEDDFECMKNDKYVDLCQSYYMNCCYNTRFKKWVPVSVVTGKEKLINHDELFTIENKFIKQNRRVVFPSKPGRR